MNKYPADSDTWMIKAVDGGDYDNRGLFKPTRVDVNWTALLQSVGVKRFKWVGSLVENGYKEIVFKADSDIAMNLQDKINHDITYSFLTVVPRNN